MSDVHVMYMMYERGMQYMYAWNEKARERERESTSP